MIFRKLKSVKFTSKKLLQYLENGRGEHQGELRSIEISSVGAKDNIDAIEASWQLERECYAKSKGFAAAHWVLSPDKKQSKVSKEDLVNLGFFAQCPKFAVEP